MPGLLLSSSSAALAGQDPYQDGELGWRRQTKGFACEVPAAFLFCYTRNCCPGRVWLCRGTWQHLLPIAPWWRPGRRQGPTPCRDVPGFTKQTETFLGFPACRQGGDELPVPAPHSRGSLLRKPWTEPLMCWGVFSSCGFPSCGFLLRLFKHIYLIQPVQLDQTSEM